MSDWRSIVPLVGVGVVAAAGAYFLFKPKGEDPEALERERRSYVSRVGRIVEGYIVEIVDQAGASIAGPAASAAAVAPTPADAATPAIAATSAVASGRSGLATNRAVSFDGGSQKKILYYSYSISGVTYETAQDVTGMEERIHLSRVAAGQTASVKYDPGNPSNSILLSDEWSGLH